MLLMNNFYHLLLDAAPWLMAGLVIAGLIHSFVPSQALASHLGQDSLSANIKAALFGAPLPLCSCSVIPAAISLRRNGASRSATVSFLVSTPETGADSIAISYALLGPFMAVIRPIAAILSAITAGLLTIALPEKTKSEPAPAATASPCQSQCGCQHSQSNSAPKAASSDHNHEHAHAPQTAGTIWQRFWLGQHYAFVDIFNDMAAWLMVGLLLAAATLTWLPTDFLTQWGGGFTAMLVMALVGVPMYICATASTPIAASLLMAGISPGAVLVFLLAGPATNMATIGIVKRELGQRAVIAYLTGVLSVAFVFGALTNQLVDYWQIDIQAQLAASQTLLPDELMLGSALILVLLFLNYARQQLRAKALI